MKATIILTCLFLSLPAMAQQGKTLMFEGYACTKDCSGHRAGYAWAERKGITNADQCGGKSNSFIEGCRSWVARKDKAEETDKSDPQNLSDTKQTPILP